MKSTLLALRRFFVKWIARFRDSRQQASQLSHSDQASPNIGALSSRSPNPKPPDPKSSEEAHARLHRILNTNQTLQKMSYEDFILGWVAMAYIAPGLNPDEAGDEHTGWPLGWRPVAAEAFRRFELKELTKEELYPHPY